MRNMVKGIELLHMKLRTEAPVIYYDAMFYVRFVAHIIHLAVKQCMKLIQDLIKKIRKFLNSVRASGKRRDSFETVKA